MENAFSQVDAGHDTVICKGSTVTIGPKKPDSGLCYAWSPDNGTISDKKSPNPIVTPLITTTYKLKVTGSDFSYSDSGSVTITVKDLTVLFDESYNQKYGFDYYHTGSYASKSLKLGDEDHVLATVSPSPYFDLVYFNSILKPYVTASPNKANAFETDITLKGISKGISVVQANCGKEDGNNINALNVCVFNEKVLTVSVTRIIEENDDVQVIPLGKGKPFQPCVNTRNLIVEAIPGGDDILEPSGKIINTGPDGICQTKAVGIDIQMIQVGYGSPVSVCVSSGENDFLDTNPQGDDIMINKEILTGVDGICNTTANSTNIQNTDCDIEDAKLYLDKVYKQAVIRWQVFEEAPCVVNYDLNRDSLCDLGDGNRDNWPTDETTAIISKCGNRNYDFNVFLVNNGKHINIGDPNIGGMDIGGMANLNQPYAFVVVKSLNEALNLKNASFNMAHELGHCLGLEHTVSDSQNLMDPFTGDHWRLRFKQWYQINP